MRCETVCEYAGILKDYTANFIEIMDIDYQPHPDRSPRKADLIAPRQYGLVRHLDE
ncbi:MAG: hypothetical protein JW860_14715 [Sedimentisphaerales bacterium]|nr:hypothetical protein [Sedimentisphaerales bacterium]